MKVYMIFAEGYNDTGEKELLKDHVYVSKRIADETRQKLYDTEVKRRIDLLQEAMKVDPSAKWHYERLMAEIEDNAYGNLNPLFEVVEVDVKE